MQLENYHLATGNERNGLAVYLRAIRSIYNKAIKSKVIDRELYPFADYKIKTEPIRRLQNQNRTHQKTCVGQHKFVQNTCVGIKA